MMVLNRARLSSIRFCSEAAALKKCRDSKSETWCGMELNSHLIVTLSQDLVILTEGHQENDGCDILKAMDPLPSLWPLTPHIHHSAIPTTTWKQCNIKIRLCCILYGQSSVIHDLLVWSVVSHLKMTFSMSNGYSMMPVVGTRTLRISCRSGKYEGCAIRSRSVR